jgi:hypothetical protein
MRDNLADMVTKGRQAKGDGHGSRLHPESRPRGDDNPSRKYPERLARGLHSGAYTHPERVPRGESHGCAKLTAESVREIRRRASTGETSKAIAIDFGVCKATVSQIRTGRHWGWLQ